MAGTIAPIQDGCYADAALQTDLTAPARSLQASVAQWLVASLSAAVALAVFLNGSWFSSYNAPNVDFSINFTAAHALRDGENPYGTTTLFERAKALGSQTNLIYSQLFTSYIQPPTSAMSLLPLTVLPWRDASRLYLVLNHALLMAAVVLSLYTIRPRLALPWLLAGASVIVAFFSQLYMSLSLGQVDPILLLLFAIAFWAYCRERHAVAGSAIAFAAAIKLVPAAVLLYFLWKRRYAALVWGVSVGAALFLVSLAYVGAEIYETYVTDTLPALAKGSTHYSNASIGAAIARRDTPEIITDKPFFYYLDEVPSGRAARVASTLMLLAGLGALALVIPRDMHLGRRSAQANPAGLPRLAKQKPERLVFEYYLVVAVTLLVSSVTWEFYVIWLLPVFLAALLSPEGTLPPGTWRWLCLAAFGALYLALNYPGDLYIFGRNDLFFHPEWVPGQWVEDRIRLYHDHPDAVLYLRLPALLLLTGLLAALTLWRRRQTDS